MLEVTNLSDPKHVVFLALRWCHTLDHSSGVFVHCTKIIYCTWQLTIWNIVLIYFCNMQNSNSKLWPSLCSYRLKCISTCMHTWWLWASLCWLSKEHFLHKCDFPSKTCPSSISQNWKYLKAAWRGSILWSVKLLSSGFDWTLCFWGLRHIIRHELC